MQPRIVGLCAATLLLVAACNPAAEPAASPNGCHPAAVPTSSTLTFTAEGKERTTVVHVPPDYSGSAPTPLVLNLHGAGSSAVEQEAFTGMDATADAQHFLVAYPQGAIPANLPTTQARGGPRGFRWNVLGDAGFNPPDAADDVVFLKQLLAEMQRSYCIDAARIYATGMSNGAIMASQLACDLSETIAAVAPVSGLRLPEPCRSSRSVPVLTFHGTADPVTLYDGGGFWTYGASEAVQRWAAHNGCDSIAMTSEPAPSTKLSTFRCPKGADVGFYTLVGAGHTWPGGPALDAPTRSVLGAESHAIDANAVMWRFFTDHPLH